MKILGDTLEKIAFEKAGIIKKKVPVVIGEYLPETKKIFEDKAKTENAPIHFAQEEYAVSNIKYTLQSLQCDVTSKEHNITETFELDLNGLYQTKNLRTVICAEGILMELGFTINNKAEKTALSNVKTITGLYGRWDVLETNPTLVLDVGHNEDGIKQILDQLQRTTDIDQRLHFVIGMVHDKDITKVLSMLPATASYYFSNAHIPRAMPHVALKEKAAAFQLQGNGFDDVNEAIAAAKENAAINDVIIVCGSVFLVAEVDR
jgi:dihydrofolate synthase/folylpolyglutamate synthase